MKAVIFDFDGVIAETESKKHSDLRRMLETKGIHMPDAITPSFIGKKTDAYLNEKFKTLTKEQIKEITKLRHANKLLDIDKIKLVDGIEPLLKQLKKVGLKIAICSGSEREFIDSFLKIKKLTNYFDLIVAGEDFSSSKPNPECYFITLNKLGLTSSDCIVVEDSPAGIQAGKDAGCTVYAVKTYFSDDKLSGADKVFSDHFDILSFMNRS